MEVMADEINLVDKVNFPQVVIQEDCNIDCKSNKDRSMEV